MPLLTAYERTRQVHGKTLGFFDNNAALSDPRGYTIKKASTSHSPLIDTIVGKTVNNLGVSVQAALAVTNPSQYGIVFNTSLYPVVEAVSDVWANKLAVVTTLAGSTGGFTDGTGTGAKFNAPFGVTVLPNGNIVVGDQANNRIRLVTPAGVVTTLAGSGNPLSANGTGAGASFYYPSGVAALQNGDVVVADMGNNLIRLVTPAGVVTTFAGSGTPFYTDGTGTGASFNNPNGICVLPNSNIVVGDSGNHLIRVITPAGVVTTLAGSLSPAFADGTGAAASFSYPKGVAALSNGNIVVADYDNHRIRLVTPAGVVTTLAGSGSPAFADGTGAGASFYYPSGVAVLPNGNIVVGDYGNSRIRLITPAGVVTTLAGDGTSGFLNGTGTAARFKNPIGVAVFPSGVIVVADNTDNRVRLITPT